MREQPEEEQEEDLMVTWLEYQNLVLHLGVPGAFASRISVQLQFCVSPVFFACLSA